jgi:hypothetical protein
MRFARLADEPKTVIPLNAGDRSEARMDRRNWWEVMKCGRQPGGENINALGTCQAALTNEYADGVNHGEHCGRCCWAIAGTLCRGQVQGTYAKKLMDCLGCEFLKQVQEDEGREFVLAPATT